jgi:cbb3-type cytochrome oxidase maturation protein
MYAIFVLIIISLTVAIGFLIAFLWAVKNNQFDDDYTPSVRILFDDKKKGELEEDISNK